MVLMVLGSFLLCSRRLNIRIIKVRRAVSYSRRGKLGAVMRKMPKSIRKSSKE